MVMLVLVVAVEMEPRRLCRVLQLLMLAAVVGQEHQAVAAVAVLEVVAQVGFLELPPQAVQPILEAVAVAVTTNPVEAVVLAL
jgi:hypothetical protein